MKRLHCIIFVLLVAVCIGAVCAKARRPEMLFVPFFTVPDYLNGVYYAPDSPLYRSQVLCYNWNIAGAGMIVVDERLDQKPLLRGYYYDYRHFLSRNHENTDKLCREMPGLIKRTVKHGRYEILQYDAGHLADYQMNRPFSVIKDKGRVIWYGTGETPGDVRLLDDGRYMIATPWTVYYVRAYPKRLVAEKYTGGRMWFRPWDGPQEVRILTDNVISLKYKGGAIEHWKVRLSAKDVEKNIEKYYRPDSAQPEWFYANECLLWRNGSVFSGTGGKVPKEMWCFRKGGPEPAPESYSDISYEKTVGRKDKAAALDAGEAKGFPALLPGMIKTFFAELFA